MSKTITGADGKEYTIEPDANLKGADLRTFGITKKPFGLKALSFQ